MSSHHIVREKQEPALLIMSLEGFEDENLGQILEWSPTVIVHEEIYEETDSMAFKIDAVVTKNPHFKTQESTHLIITDNDPLEDALKFLVGEQYPAVNVITNTFLLKDYALFVEEINMVIFIANKKIYPVKSGFSKWLPAGEKLEIMHEVHHLQTSGLTSIEDHIFETEKDGFFSVSFEQPFIFISEVI